HRGENMANDCEEFRAAADQGNRAFHPAAHRAGLAVRWLTLAALPLFLMMGVAAAGEVSGPARVIDGDTLEITGTRIRLWGIDAPEKHQTCEGKAGEIYECGRDSAAVMQELTRGRT